MKRRQFLRAGSLLGVAGAFDAAAKETPRTIDVDVLVIGAGAAGLSAAVEARLAGAHVAVVEKMGTVGGNSLLSLGSVSVPGTPHQQINGIEDRPEDFQEDILRAGYVASPSRVKRLVNEALPTWIWTQRELGVRWDPRLLIQDKDHRKPRTVYVKGRSGNGLILPMFERARMLDVDFYLQHRFERFDLDDQGRVVGAFIRDPAGTAVAVRASRGVILAAGGFGADPEFRKMQNWRLSEKVGTTNHPGATSESLREAYRIGAWCLHVEYISCIAETSPDEQGWGTAWRFTRYCAATQGLWVTPERGRRFVNETASSDALTNAVLDRILEKESVIAIADAKAVAQPSAPLLTQEDVEEFVQCGLIQKYSSLEKLAEDFSIPLAALREEIDAYNSALREGRSRDAWMRPILLSARPINQGPWYVSRVLPKVQQCTGGVLIDEDARVLSVTNDKPIEGLFAAGEITGGIHGITQLGAMGLIDAMVFGRIAGRNAAKAQ